MISYRLLVQNLEKELEEFDLCCPENFRYATVPPCAFVALFRPCIAVGACS